MSGIPAWVRDKKLVGGLVFFAALAVYFPAAAGGAFHFDDMHSIVENEGVRSLGNIPKFFVDPTLWSGELGNTMYRPTLLVTFAIDHALWGENAAGWLLTSAVVHAACALLVFKLAGRLGLSAPAALFAGAVFALHPVMSEVQNYVSSRSESVAALMMLCALHVYLSARTSRGARAVLLFAAAMALSALSLLSKETTAAFCAALFWMELVAFRASAAQRALRAFGALVGFGVVLGAVFLVRRHLLGVAVADLKLTNTAGLDAQVGGGRSVVANMLTQANAQMAYVGKLLFPVRLNVDYDLPIVQSLGGAAASIAVILAACLAAIWSALRGSRLFPLCVGWFVCFSLVTFIVPLNVVMNEHRLYLPMIAVALLAGAALARVAELKGFALAAAPLVCFPALIVQRSREWRDDETLWSVAVERAPNSARAHMHYGATFHERANESRDPREKIALYDKALAQYRVSEEMHPGWSDVELNIGNASINRAQVTRDPADFEAALAAFRKMGEIVGTSAERPLMSQALALTGLGRHDEAIAIISDLKARDSSRTTYYDRPLAHALRAKGDKKAAAEAMERVIAIEEPELSTDGLLELAWWKFEDGDRDGAFDVIQRALAVADKRPSEFRAYLWAARWLVLTGRPKDGEKMFLLARKHGWNAPEDEVRWVAGGRTPGVYTGTFVRK